jgi:hypothetical protein
MKGAGKERAPDPMPSREERAFYSERRGAMRASRRRAATAAARATRHVRVR